MGFTKVREALTEYYESVFIYKILIKLTDLFAVAVTALYLANQFVAINPILQASLPYALLCTVMLAVGAKGKLGLLIATGGQMLLGFIQFTRAMLGADTISLDSISWNAVFAILFWGMMTFFTVLAVNKEGMGKSILSGFFKASGKKKGPARTCPKCGTKEMNADAGFCRSCGTKLPEAAPAPAPATPAANTAVCPKCGKQCDSETAFCPVCGTKIKA